MKRVFVTATTALVTYLLAGPSAAAEGAGVWTAERAAALCSDKSGKMCEAAMFSYVRGLTDGITLIVQLQRDSEVKDLDPGTWWQCIEESRASLDQLKAMFSKSLKEHPESWQMSAGGFFLVHVVYPLCEQVLKHDEPTDPNAQFIEPAE